MANCMACMAWIWAQVKRPFISMAKTFQRENNHDASAASVSASLSCETEATAATLISVDADSEPLTCSSAVDEWKYDVYLSFGAADTNKGLIPDLHNGLHKKGVKTFKDDRELEVGDPVPPTLKKAITESRFAIVVLSRDYAQSTWCLKELTEIYERMYQDQNRIIPILYHLPPSNQSPAPRLGKRSFNEAFSGEHKTPSSGGSEKLQRWSQVLEEVAGYASCWSTKNHKTHKELVQAVVKFLVSEVLPDAIEPNEDFEEEKHASIEEETKKLGAVTPSTSQWKHDVFLSFRGPDTRKGIASSLFQKLTRRGLKAFMDRESIPYGKSNSSILTAIQESRSSIVILSPRYASSPWCLNELAEIVRGRLSKDTLVIPVFYNVEPHHARHQTGNFKELYRGHGEQRHEEKVKEWKAALTTVANIQGFESDKFEYDKDLVKAIVKHVCSQLRNQEMESSAGGFSIEAAKRALVKVGETLLQNEIASASHALGGYIGEKSIAAISCALMLFPDWKLEPNNS